MFFSEVILSKSGPLAKVWLAAHWEKKLSKRDIVQANISSSVDAIIDNRDPKALRLTGQLLVGVARIYSRKTKYLLDDCNEAKLSLQMAFRPGLVELPQSAAIAPFSTITLPDAFTEFDVLLPMPDLNSVSGWIQNHVPSPATTPVSQARMQDITLPTSLQLTPRISAFGRHPFDNDAMQLDEGLHPIPLDFGFGDVSLERGRGFQSDVEVGRDALGAADITQTGPELRDFGSPGRSLEASFLGKELDEGKIPPLDLFGELDETFGQPGIAPFTDIFDPAHQANVSGLGEGIAPGGNIMFNDISGLTETEQQQQSRPRKKRVVQIGDTRIELTNAEVAVLLRNTSALRAPTRYLPSSMKQLQMEQYLAMSLQARVALPVFEDISDAIKVALYAEPLKAGQSLQKQLRQTTELPPAAIEEELQYEENIFGKKRLRSPISPARPLPVDEDLFGQDAGLLEYDNQQDLTGYGDISRLHNTSAFDEFQPRQDEVDADEQQEREQARLRRKSTIPSVIDIFDTQEGSLDTSEETSASGQTKSGFSRDTEKAINLLQTQFAENNGRSLSTQMLMAEATKSQAARFFYEMLLLSTKNMLTVAQSEPYGVILIDAKPTLNQSQSLLIR